MTAQRGTRRAQAATETRELILQAALRCFATEGYAKTTVNGIAATAGVAVATVYSSVGGKPVLLEELARRGIGDTAVADTMGIVEHATSGRQIVRAIADGTSATYNRHRDLIALLLDTASMEPVVQRLTDEAITAYRVALTRAADRLEQLGALADGIDRDRAVDILWYFFGLFAWPRLVKDATWSWDEAEQWLKTTAERTLLREG